MDKTIVINLLGSPGTGKSTIASELFAKMKWKGMDVELVTEFAKDLVYEERKETFKNQIYIFGKQHHRLFRLKGKVKYIITDCPLLLSKYYNNLNKCETTGVLNTLIDQEFNKYENINFLLKRKKKYVEKGRNETESESDKIYQDMVELFSDVGNLYHLDGVANEVSDKIIEIITEKYEN